VDKKLMEILATQSPTKEQISWLSSEQISGLSRAQISGLSRAQISGLSRAQISWLSSEQISWLSSEQISWLSSEQMEFIESIPKVENLYTNILRVIKEEMGGKPDQSTFGERNEGKSHCGSPMCIGGTTVWLAGNKGYKLAKEIGFGSAAALIHKMSRPDAPVPRYDSYPNDWALAFVEARAEEEK
jgi:hypothetical protein